MQCDHPGLGLRTEFWSQLCHQTTVWLRESLTSGAFIDSLTKRPLSQLINVRSPVFITQAPVWMHVSVYFSWRQEKTLWFYASHSLWSSSEASVIPKLKHSPFSNHPIIKRAINQPSEHFRLWCDGGFLPVPRGSSGHPTIYGKMRGAASPFWPLCSLQWLEKTECNVFQLLMMGRCWIAEWESLGSEPCLLSL